MQEDKRTLSQKLTFNALKRKITVVFDRIRGLDFLNCVESEDIGLDPYVVYRYAPSGDKFLNNALKAIKVNKDDAIIDIGCGKGSAMRTMLKFYFAKVDGIEIAQVMGKIAENNFNKLKSNRTKIFIEDATEFKNFQDYNMYYFYNPFPNKVMANVINNIKKVAQVSEKEKIIIYNNPECHNLIIDGGVFNKLAEFPDEWGNKIFIYSNKNKENSRLEKI